MFKTKLTAPREQELRRYAEECNESWQAVAAKYKAAKMAGHKLQFDPVRLIRAVGHARGILLDDARDVMREFDEGKAWVSNMYMLNRLPEEVLDLMRSSRPLPERLMVADALSIVRSAPEYEYLVRAKNLIRGRTRQALVYIERMHRAA
ncbi:hypothetical protein C4556_03975 [Candidatus Parcubacteria bacterium]|nr:MAG: hypothetical protein C4556_03975 [Candidatus Parcubacteria bacterium]